MTPPLRFTIEEAEEASDQWGFNCGPAAICALLGKTPSEIRQHVQPFKGYLGPREMYAALRSLKREFSLLIEDGCAFPHFGLARIQFDGPWCYPGVPFAARYAHTHWVASVSDALGEHAQVFDVNGGDWLSYFEWTTMLMPLLLSCHKRATGEWWTTHAIEVTST